MREIVDDAPDEEEAGGDLHEGCEEGCADDAWEEKQGLAYSMYGGCWVKARRLAGCVVGPVLFLFLRPTLTMLIPTVLSLVSNLILQTGH